MATEHFNIDFILVEILVIVSIVSILVRRIKMPYTLGLILTGLGISVFNIQIGIELDPELILTLFLPALLFEGAMNIDVNVLKKNIKSITLLSLVGTFLTTIIIGFVLRLFIKMPLSISLLFASMIAPTDPIAVIGIFKELGVGKSLSVLIEGESLFNDGVAIVLFRI
ncbi:Na+/H+ antiporter, partial [archaeon]|nr:Na+/H+ antiporter [archaeon]